jgi:hypothetical protein
VFLSLDTDAMAGSCGRIWMFREYPRPWGSPKAGSPANEDLAMQRQMRPHPRLKASSLQVVRDVPRPGGDATGYSCPRPSA